MTPKPKQPQNIGDEPSLNKEEVTPQEAPVESSDEDLEDGIRGGPYQYHLVGQEPANAGEDEDEDFSNVSIADQVQALVAQAQADPENLSPAVQGLVAESAAKQEAEERKEKAELWADTKAERDIELTDEKVAAIKNIMKGFSLPTANLPSYLQSPSASDQQGLTRALNSLKKE